MYLYPIWYLTGIRGTGETTIFYLNQYKTDDSTFYNSLNFCGKPIHKLDIRSKKDSKHIVKFEHNSGNAKTESAKL